MLLRFLSCFSLFREAVAARISSEDRVRLSESLAILWQAEYRKAVADAFHHRNVLEDWLSLQLTGRKIHGIAPDLPEGDSADRVDVGRGRVTGRDMVHQAEREFYQKLEEFNSSATVDDIVS